MIKLLVILLALAALGSMAGGANASNAPTATTLFDPTTAPTGGEPGMPAGPPNPGYALHCGEAPYDDSVRGVVRVDPEQSTASTNPPCSPFSAPPRMKPGQ